MTFPTRNLKQKVTRWTTVPNAFGSGVTFGVPTILDARWERRTEIFRDSNGNERSANDIVYLASDVDVGDWLFEGESLVADPTVLTGAKEVRQFNRTPDLRQVISIRKAFL